jgi:hypothetical protein
MRSPMPVTLVKCGLVWFHVDFRLLPWINPSLILFANASAGGFDSV